MELSAILSEIQETYVADRVPWVIGYSGGKDSTTVLQMVFYALSRLQKRKLSKEIHVVCNDTLVENPAIAGFVDGQLEKIRVAGKTQLFKHKPDLFNVVKVTPKIEDRFWVNLIGKGYPSPNRWFRWCTERMKINPTNEYIQKTVNGHGRAIVVLGTRKAESSNRAASMSNYDTNERLRKHSLPNVFVYAPIADMSNNEVWAYLLQAPKPWGGSNKELLSLYGNACSGGECPFMIDTGTQSCGKSRFGCWVCTVVDRDKSMENIIENGEKRLEGLLNFRNWLYDIRQQTSQYVPRHLELDVKFGCFLLKTRREILRRLLDKQERLCLELIASEELDYVNNLLEKDSEGQVKEGLREFVYDLPNRRRVVVVSDFDVLLTPRKRLGPVYLKEAKLVGGRCLSRNYLQSTRAMYYWRQNGHEQNKRL